MLAKPVQDEVPNETMLSARAQSRGSHRDAEGYILGGSHASLFLETRADQAKHFPAASWHATFLLDSAS